MTVKDCIKEGIKYSLRLPEFNKEEKDLSAALMNQFYERLAAEIIAYTERESSVRKYRSEYLIEKAENGDISVTVSLSVRFRKKGGTSEVKHKCLTQLWENGYLKRHTVSH